MSTCTILSMVLGGASLILGFIGESLGSEGMKQDVIDEIKQDYVLVPKTKDKQ